MTVYRTRRPITALPSFVTTATARGRLAAIAALLLLPLAACTGSAPNGSQADIDGTVHVCSSCHGLDGKSINPTFPRLAGQQKDYLVAQLTAFRGKTRADPHAHTYMWGMAARLSDATIDGVATYFSALPPAVGSPGDPKEMEAGKKIFTEGIEAENIPACMACHGEQAQGQGEIPRLAGQHKEYMRGQIEAFAENSRANEIMHENAMHLTSPEIVAVTTYLSAQ
jgi:cytochrome c553